MALLKISIPSNDLIQRVVAVSQRESEKPLTLLDIGDIQTVVRFWVDDNVPNEVSFSALTVQGTLDVSSQEYDDLLCDAESFSEETIPTYAIL